MLFVRSKLLRRVLKAMLLTSAILTGAFDARLLAPFPPGGWQDFPPPGMRTAAHGALHDATTTGATFREFAFWKH